MEMLQRSPIGLSARRRPLSFPAAGEAHSFPVLPHAMGNDAEVAKAKGGTRDYGVMSASAISYITGAAHKIPHFGWRADRPCGEGDGEVRHLLRRCLGGGLAQQGAVVSKGASGRAGA